MSGDITITTHVRYLYPGVFFSDEASRPVESRDPDRIAREAEPGVFAFEFYDIVTTTVMVDGQEVGMTSRPIRKSGMYYIDAQKFTSADIEALPGDHSILLANMRWNGWDHVVRCRTGNFQPLGDRDHIVATSKSVTP